MDFPFYKTTPKLFPDFLCRISFFFTFANDMSNIRTYRANHTMQIISVPLHSTTSNYHLGNNREVVDAGGVVQTDFQDIANKNNMLIII